MAGAVAGKIQDGVNRQRQHRALHQRAAFGPEHRLGFRVFAKQPAIDQRRQILATLGGQFETVLDRTSCCHPRSLGREWIRARLLASTSKKSSGSAVLEKTPVPHQKKKE